MGRSTRPTATAPPAASGRGARLTPSRGARAPANARRAEPRRPGPSWSSAPPSNPVACRVRRSSGAKKLLRADAIRRPKTRASLGLGRPPGSYRLRSARPGSEKELEKNFKRSLGPSSPPGMAPGKGTASPRGWQARACELGRGQGKSPGDVGQTERLARLLGGAPAVPRLLGRLGKLSED